jgi:hypothetical protein
MQRHRRLAFLFCGLLTLVIAGTVQVGIFGLPTGIVNAESQVSGSSGKDLIRIQNEGYKKDRKGPVEFSHTKHAREYKVSCWNCHHVYEDGANVWSPLGKTAKCSQCHHPLRKEGTALKLQTAYHVNCKNCHKTLAECNESTGPHRKCYGCHEKE